MTLTQLFLAELEREAPRARQALEQVPLGRDDWKPHPKSMPLGRLAGLVAGMPSWRGLIIEQDELNLTPPPGQGYIPSSRPLTRLVTVHGKRAERARRAVSDDRRVPDNELAITRRGAGRAESAAAYRAARHAEPPRASSRPIDGVSAAERPHGSAIYGPSADDQQFA